MLNKIIEHQKATVALLEESLSFSYLLSHVEPAQRDFYQALQKCDTAFILECKQRSPSEGVLREEYPISDLVKKYSRHADAISVLTNNAFFGGSFNHLKLASHATAKPLLCKDIIVNPYQVAYARRFGADAVLLMLSVLNNDQYRDCEKIAKQLNMSVVTEVYTEEEVYRAIALKAKIIAINHRCFHTMQMDMDRVYKLKSLLPKHAYIIAASGLHSHSQIQQLAPHVNGFLIGSALSKSNHVEIKLRELIYGQVKICGLTRQEDVRAVFEAGATTAGFNFAPNSPRRISQEQALAIQVAPMNYVGVFVKQSIEEVVEIATNLKLNAVQLHGDESAEYIQELRKKLPTHCQIHYAMSGHHIIPPALPLHVDKLLIDNATVDGGTGKQFDWETLTLHPLKDKIILAGGINLQNIKKAQQLGFLELDVNSGVESSPGIKQPEKLISLFKQMRMKVQYA
jgi:indole-3-glycerol phosphate synthase/phosphoribosylanthranilate isomerase